MDFENFIAGLTKFCKGSVEEKQKIIFDICDNNEDGTLDSTELKLVVRAIQLYLLGLEVLKKPENSSLAVRPERSIEYIARRRSKTVMKPIIHAEEELSIPQHVQNILLEYGNGVFLNFEEFQNFIFNAPRLFSIFDMAFNENL